jgi:hypothetical protein
MASEAIHSESLSGAPKADWEKAATHLSPEGAAATSRHSRSQHTSAESIPSREVPQLHIIQQSHPPHHLHPIISLSHSLRNRWRSTWAPESIACIVAGIWFGAIILILVLHNGKPLPQYRFGITLNALVAVFALFVKAGLFIPLTEGLSQMKWETFRKNPRKLSDMELYDSASRDWWGCVRLIFNHDVDSWT